MKMLLSFYFLFIRIRFNKDELYRDLKMWYEEKMSSDTVIARYLWGDWFQESLEYQTPRMLKSLIQNGVVQ